MRWLWNRKRQAADQAASAADQTASDKDQTASDTDQSASDRDQTQAEIDQLASEREQAAADRDLAGRVPGNPEIARTHELTRAERAASTLDRHAATLVRSQVSFERDEQAKQRDKAARTRDRVAEERDRAAEEHDRELERIDDDLGREDPRAARALEALAEMRDKGAAYRTQAAGDRERAARDRQSAAADRRHLISELERMHMDDLTGAYRRGMGEIAIVNEIERARRSQGALALAYIDCNGLKKLNDHEGHAAGDAMLQDLVAVLQAALRPYDPVVRWGGDEFLCAISGADPEDVRGRLDGVRAALSEERAPDVTVGLAALKEGDTLETFIERADADLLEARHRR